MLLLLSITPCSALLSDSDAPDRMLREQRGVAYDQKFWHARQRRTLNKRARYNVLFGPEMRAASDEAVWRERHRGGTDSRAYRQQKGGEGDR